MGSEEVGGGVVVVIAGVRDVFLRDSREVRDGVCERVRAAEREDDARIRGIVRERNVAAGVGQKGARVPCLVLSVHYAMRHGIPHAGAYRDQLESLKVAVGAVARAAERLLYAQTGCAYAVRDVYDARELLQLPEEVLQDQSGIVGLVDERVLRRIADGARYGGENHEIVQE
jgi:uncharacterized protein YecE (DUF72 family)